jgi:hypothetical protein
VVQSRGLWRTAAGALFPPAHGEFPNSLAELFYFGRRYWVRVFERSGFRVARVEPNRIAYSGHTIFPGIPLRVRRRLSPMLGSSVLFYICARPA